MNNKTAFIFPAFITSFTKKEVDVLEKNNFYLSHYLNRASDILHIDLPDFDYDANTYQNDELFSQIIAYIFSCAFSDLLIKKKIKPDYVAGYSMGIYASLYASESIEFEDGLKIIANAYQLVNELSVSKKFGMGAVIGLTFSDIAALITNSTLDVEIININNDRSIVLAGLKKDIHKFLKIAALEGAFTVSELTVDTPYHSKYLTPFKDRFSKFVSGIIIYNPRAPILSTYNQREIIDASDISRELVFNLTEKINWYKTMQELLKKNVSVFYECGAGKDLSKIARFVEGDYVIKSIDKI